MTAERLKQIVEECIRRELEPGATLPPFGEDVVESGAVDSMAWVAVVRGVESATGCEGLGERLMDGPRSARAMVAALESLRASTIGVSSGRSPVLQEAATATGRATVIAGWGAVTGKRCVPAAQIEREFELPAGKISRGAGIETVSRVASGEDEVTLGVAAVDEALRQARLAIGDVDLLITTSETAVGHPQLGAQLHARLLADEACGALDVGGACMGLVNALAVAKAFLQTGAARCILVATADAHSRVLTPAQVTGEFGGLFGDGASAFVITVVGNNGSGALWRLGEWVRGGSGAYSQAIRVTLGPGGTLQHSFEGEALARAAVERLEQLIHDLELRSGASRHAAAAFATHQPNPRLVELLARQLGVPVKKFPVVARTSGNLGSSTCGVALAKAISARAESESVPGPIFLASLAPGLLWSGMVLHPENQSEHAH